MLLRRFLDGGLSVIPVIPPGAEADKESDWSTFMEDFHRVDFRISDPDPMKQMNWFSA